MSAISSVDYPVIPNTPSVSVIEATEYQPSNQYILPVECNGIKYNPVNGGNFKKGSMIEFCIRPQKDTWLTGAKTSLNFTFKAKPLANATVTTNMGIYSTHIGSAGCIRALRVTNGPNLLEEINHYNHSQSMLQNCFTSTPQMRSACTLFDGLLAGTSDSTNAGKATGKKISAATDTGSGTSGEAGNVPDLTCAAVDVSIPISLSSLFGPAATKSIPLGMIDQPITIKIYLTNDLSEVYYSKSSTNVATNYDANTSDYEITNVSLECHQTRFSESVSSLFDNKKEHTWNIQQLESCTNNVDPSSQYEEVLLSNTQYKNVKSVMNQTWYSQSTPSTVIYASVMPGLYQYNVSVNGMPISNHDVGNNILSSLENSSALFAANLLSIQRNSIDSWHSKSQLMKYGSYVQGSFSPYNINTSTTDFFPANGPSAIPTCLTSQFIYTDADKPVDACAFYAGMSTLMSKDLSRELVGRDFRGKQITLQLRRFNAVSNTSAPQILHTLLHIGAKIHLERGLMRRTA